MHLNDADAINAKSSAPPAPTDRCRRVRLNNLMSSITSRIVCSVSILLYFHSAAQFVTRKYNLGRYLKSFQTSKERPHRDSIKKRPTSKRPSCAARENALRFISLLSALCLCVCVCRRKEPRVNLHTHKIHFYLIKRKRSAV